MSLLKGMFERDGSQISEIDLNGNTTTISPTDNGAQPSVVFVKDSTGGGVLQGIQGDLLHDSRMVILVCTESTNSFEIQNGASVSGKIHTLDEVNLTLDNVGQTIGLHCQTQTAADIWTELFRGPNADTDTYIKVTPSSTRSGFSSGNWNPAYNNSTTDTRGEFSNNRFTPDKDGLYRFAGTVYFRSFNDQDQLAVRLQDITNSSNVGNRLGQRGASGSPFDTAVVYGDVKDLTGGTTYEIQCVNFNSDYDIGGNSEGSIQYVGPAP